MFLNYSGGKKDVIQSEREIIFKKIIDKKR